MTLTNENDKEMLKEIPKVRYTSPEERQKVIDNLRSIIIIQQKGISEIIIYLPIHQINQPNLKQKTGLK